MAILTPISQNTLADAVTDKIREAIIKGELQPGERLTEPSLAASLGVSRSPVREAIVRLEGEGLIVREANHGISVWIPVLEDIDEILSLRVMMETLAANLIIEQEKLNEKVFNDIEKIYQAQKRAFEAQDHLLLTKEDRRFHDYLIMLTEHVRLMKIWQEFMGQLEVLIYRRVQFDPTVSGTVLTDHQNIIDLLKAKDQDALFILHREINMRVGSEMKAILQSSAPRAKA